MPPTRRDTSCDYFQCQSASKLGPNKKASSGVKRAGLKPLFDVRFEYIQLAGSRCSRTINPRSFRLQQVLADRFAIESGQLADGLNAESLPLQLFDVTHFFPP
jgi:hypothetical protein